MNSKLQTLIYAVIFTIWTVRLYYKLYDKKTKRYVLSIGVLIVVFMVIRITKVLMPNELLMRLMWYLYYLPLIYIPSLFFLLNSKDNKKTKIVVYALSTILFLLVLTNDFHELVFKFPNGKNDFDNYKHCIGYYIVSIWIFGCFLVGMIKMFIKSIKKDKSYKSFLPIFVLLIGALYTIMYVCDLGAIRKINMPVFNSALICIGIEIMLSLNLIANNKKYIDKFTNSNVDMAIISLDAKTSYFTKSFSDIPRYIISDIVSGTYKNEYNDGNIRYILKKNKDCYVIIRKDLTKIYDLENFLKKKQVELKKIESSLINESRIKEELYDVRYRNKIVSKIESELYKHIKNAKDILNNDKLSSDDLNKIKSIISFCKKKSALVISSVNSTMFDYSNIKVVIEELLRSNNIDGLVIVKSNLILSSKVLSDIYEVIYSIISEINKETIMIYIVRNKNCIVIKCLISGNVEVRNSLRLKNFVVNNYNTDTEVIFRLEDKI